MNKLKGRNIDYYEIENTLGFTFEICLLMDMILYGVSGCKFQSCHFEL